MFNSREGLENVVGAVLLVAIVTVLTSIIYMWLSGYVIRTVAIMQEQSKPEFIKIAAVNYTGTQLQVFIINVGDVPAEIILAQVLNTSSRMLVDSCIVQLTGFEIPPGETRVINITCTLTRGSYVVEVHTRTTSTRYYFLVR